MHSDSAGRPLSVLQDVYKSEADTNQRNQAIGHLMFAYGYIKTNRQQARRSLHTAVRGRRQCEGSRDNGRHARRGGRNPMTGKQVINEKNVP